MRELSIRPHQILSQVKPYFESAQLWEEYITGLVIEAAVSYHERAYAQMEAPLARSLEVAALHLPDDHWIWMTARQLQTALYDATGRLRKIT